MVLHVCYPFAIKDFVGETARYIELFRPPLTIINSTVGVGTTRTIAERTRCRCGAQPGARQHVRNEAGTTHLHEIVGGIDRTCGKSAAEHFESAGFKTRILSAPEATELAKLTETTYFGLLIAWAQELERTVIKTGQAYEEIISFYEEISFFPTTKYFQELSAAIVSCLTSKSCASLMIPHSLGQSNLPIVRRSQRESRKKLSEQTTKATGSGIEASGCDPRSMRERGPVALINTDR